MRNKLFTPFNLGAIELRHRLVVDWGQAISLRRDVAPEMRWWMKDRRLSGGLVIHDPGFLVWPGAAPPSPITLDAIDSRWRSVLDQAGSARQSALARLGAAQLSKDLFQDNIEPIIEAYLNAAARARSIGFAGIELDAAQGAVPELLLELVEALARFFGRDRVGVRLSPRAGDDVLRSVHDQEVAFVHLVDVDGVDQDRTAFPRLPPATEALRRAYPELLIASGGQSLSFAIDLVESRWADAFCFSGAALNAQFPRQVRQAWTQRKA